MSTDFISFSPSSLPGKRIGLTGVPEKLDELMVVIESLGVRFIDEYEVRRCKYEPFQAPLQTNLKFKRDVPNRGRAAPKVRKP